jgi:hypothetical protein
MSDELWYRVPERYRLPHENRPIGEPFFTGFKGDDDVGYVAQFLLTKAEGGPYYYVNIPGMQSGRFEKGDNFDIGTERIYPNIQQDELESILETGWQKILDISGL